MEALKKLVNLKKAEWAGKVRVVALSIDQDVEKWKAAIANRGYGDFEHYNLRANKECKAALYYGIKKIPYCSLIDKQGNVAYLGHPGSRQLHLDIDELVQDKPIVGTGCAPFTQRKDQEWTSAGNNITPAQIQPNLVKFMTACTKVFEDPETKALA